MHLEQNLNCKAR